MRLIRFDGNKTGLVVNLVSGIHVVDVIASVGALVPEDPISHGILNGLLKPGSSWAQVLEHWEMARKGLRRLATLAQTPGLTQVVLCRLDEVRRVSARPPNGIGSLDIREPETTSQDPTGRAVMERQFDETSTGTVATTSLPGQTNQFESRNRSGAARLTVHFGGHEGKARDARK
jgi:hypothetical protein